MEDQYTDRSGAFLTKIASCLTSPELAELALDTHKKLHRDGQTKIASFKTDSIQDVFLSRIYFEAQKNEMPLEKAAEIDDRLTLFETLYEFPNAVSFKKMEKVAQLPEYELLPMCKIATFDELIQSGEDFSKDYKNLATDDRVTFAQNFAKIAFEVGVGLPEDVCIYTGINVEKNPELEDYVFLRKVAMERQGASGEAFECFDGFDFNKASNAELYKLAQVLDVIDNAYDLVDKLPDGWHSVFQVKQATLDVDEKKNLTKAEVISRYGTGILEEVENPDGSLDQKRLHDIIKGIGEK